jgi:uncharacterized protein YcfL
MKKLLFILSTTLLVSCSVQKELTSVEQKPIINNSYNQPTKSKSSDWQQEQVNIMKSWTQEQRDEFRRTL